ncbi:hypothetical protein KAR28_01790 [Candidatus Parcubacteria bacterium]|nr:hypothetical protein [Candidatus Parcubacteria bacterium]
MKKEIISGIFFVIIVLALAALYSAPTIIHFDKILSEASTTISFFEWFFWFSAKTFLVGGIACAIIAFTKWLIKKRYNSSPLHIIRRRA